MPDRLQSSLQIEKESLPCLEGIIHQLKYETKSTPSEVCKDWVVLLEAFYCSSHLILVNVPK